MTVCAAYPNCTGPSRGCKCMDDNKKPERSKGAGMNIEQFSERYPVGTAVRYYPIKGSPYFRFTAIKSEPWELGSGSGVVKVEGESGGVSIDHIESGHK